MKRRTLGEEQIYSMVCGAIKNCIDNHGPVDYDSVPSAAKRISGLLVAELQKIGTESLNEMGILAEIAELKSEVKKLTDKKNSLGKNRNDLLAVIRKHNIPLGKVNE